ncbi:MAG: cysteine synthase family protein [Mesorhizobium sp.]
MTANRGLKLAERQDAVPGSSAPTPVRTSVLDCIGDTPLVLLSEGIYAKAEYFNPSGSIKARMANYMIERAEAEGLLKPGGTIVEATSGNTGNALSMVAAAKGYRMIVVMPDGYSNERARISRGFGAEIRLVGNFQVNEAREEAKRLGKLPGHFCPAQFDNEWNVDENREWLGREIVAQLPVGLKIDAVVQGVGTGGTLIGTAQALRQWHNPALKVFAMEPSESRTIECCIAADHRIEGISDGFIPTLYDRHRAEIDEVICVDSAVAIEEAQWLASVQGHFVGPSSGANFWAAREIRRKYPHLKNVLTFLCDRGEKYLSLMYGAKVEAEAERKEG